MEDFLVAPGELGVGGCSSVEVEGAEAEAVVLDSKEET